MQLHLAKTFPLDVGAEAAWRLLCDTRRVGECMPGAEITEQLGENLFQGLVSIQAGPVCAKFKGELAVTATDAAAMKILLHGKGTDITGSSATSLDIEAWIVPEDGGRCQLAATSDIHLSGKLANFGGRMFMPIADQVLKQFGAQFAARAQEYAVAPQAVEAPSPPAAKLNIVALLWNALRDFFSQAFGKANNKNS